MWIFESNKKKRKKSIKIKEGNTILFREENGSRNNCARNYFSTDSV